MRTPFVTAPPLIEAIGTFIAFVLPGPDPRVDALAGACIATFEPFRAPLTAAEIARRGAGRLTGRQEGYLRRWGYAHVFADFRFHMSLTGPIGDAHLRAATLAGLRGAAGAALATRLSFDGLALFCQEPGGGNFRLLRRFPFCAGQDAQ